MNGLANYSDAEFDVAFDRVKELFATGGMSLAGLSIRQQKKVTGITNAILEGHLVILRRRGTMFHFAIIP